MFSFFTEAFKMSKPILKNIQLASVPLSFYMIYDSYYGNNLTHILDDHVEDIKELILQVPNQVQALTEKNDYVADLYLGVHKVVRIGFPVKAPVHHKDILKMVLANDIAMLSNKLSKINDPK